MLGLDSQAGILVRSIEPKIPLQNGYIKEGDVIIRFNQKAINGIDELHRILDESTIGKTAELTLIRHGKLKRVAVVPGELPG